MNWTGRLALEHQKQQKTIAVVGAGMAGLTTAYKLAQNGYHVEIFEASQRIGGRIFTDHDAFLSQQQFCEKGGEWIDSTHHEIQALARELGLDVQDISHKREGQDLFYFAGQYYGPKDFLDFEPGRDTKEGAYLTLANYIRADRDKAKRSKSYERELDFTNMHDYLKKAQEETNTPDWVIDSIEVAYKGEFGVETTEQSSLLLINQIGVGPRHPFEVYGPKQDESHRIKGGNAALIARLKEKLDEMGVPFHAGHKLTRIDYVRNAGRPHFCLKFLEGRQPHNHEFDYLVSAIPFTKLREVVGLDKLRQQQVLSRDKFKAIKELQYGNIVKIMLGMNSLPWKNIPDANGSFRTDDPYLQNTWITSVGQKGEASILTVLIAGREAQQKMREIILGCRSAFASMVGLSEQEIFNNNKSFHAWPQDQFYRGSYSAFAPGQYTTIREICGTPEAGGQWGFVGEHTDPQDYGYMNGAMRSGLWEAIRIMAREQGMELEQGQGVARL